MSKRKHRVGIIGCGATSGHFLQGWGAWPDEAEVAAVCDVAPKQMARRKEDYPKVCGQAAEYADYHRMLAEADLDIVCVCSFSDRHMEHTEDCLAAGKHVFVEKPVGYDLEEARRFKYLASRHRELKVAVAYTLRYYKAFMDLKALIDSGALGQIVTCEISYSHGRHYRDEEAVDEAGTGEPPKARRHAKRHPYEDRGGNYIRSSQLVHSTHPWDLARYLCGEARKVFCATGDLGTDMGILWMKNGALCHVLSGSVRAAKVGYMQRQIVQAHGTKGTAWLTREDREPFRWQCHYKTDGDIVEAPHVTDLPETSHGATVRTRNLLDAIAGKAELICSMEDAATTTELLHALWLSRRTFCRVPVLPANHSG